jgi:tRNA-modifying protein YgfZ
LTDTAAKTLRATEYLAATAGVGLIDTSDRGRLRFSGDEHLEFLQRLSTNDTLGCDVGAGLRTVFCDPRGRIVEVLELCRVDVDHTAGFVAPKRTASLIDWLERYHFSERIEWHNDSDNSQQLDIVGPRAVQMCTDVLSIDASQMPRFCRLSHPSILAMRTDRGGHPGVRLWGSDLLSPRQELTAAGAVLMSSETRELLRVQWGEAGAGELTLEHNPWEAGLDDAIHMAKGCYTGQEVIARLDAYQKVKQHLVGLRLANPVAAGTPLEIAGSTVGVVTSVAQSPELGDLALAYLRTAHCQTGTEVVAHSETASRPTDAVVSDLPFLMRR